jgi:hypothetical protein
VCFTDTNTECLDLGTSLFSLHPPVHLHLSKPPEAPVPSVLFVPFSSRFNSCHSFAAGRPFSNYIAKMHTTFGHFLVAGVMAASAVSSLSFAPTGSEVVRLVVR